MTHSKTTRRVALLATTALVGTAFAVAPAAAQDDPNSPIAGMPVLECWKGKTTIVLKRSMRAGFAGVENELFFHPKTMMLFGDAKDSLEAVYKAL